MLSEIDGVVLGRFVIEQRLGAGGMGVVYSALDRERDERVALKTLARVEPRALYRFKREFRALQDVVHPNLVRLRELVNDGELWFFTMELLTGVSLLDWVRPGAHEHREELTASSSLARSRDLDESSPSAPTFRLPGARAKSRGRSRQLDLERLRRALPQLARGVDALHRAGKLHCDVKPSNVLVTEQGRVVLLDFGLVRELTMAEDGIDNELFGTVAYISPEAARGDEIGPASDWYSVGVVLYEALTGRLPYEGRAVDVLRRKRGGRPLAPHVLDATLPEDLSALAIELLDPEPSRRPSRDDVLKRLGAESAVPLSAAGLGSISEPDPFLGREDELEALRAAFETARAGQTVTVFVEGSSGVGKTTLIDRFFEELKSEATVLQGRCYERESLPYKGLDTLVDALCGRLLDLGEAELSAILPPEAALLPRLFPVLARAIPARSSGADRLDPHELRFRGFAALRELFVRLSQKKALLLFIDDLQWADLDSVALLAEIAREPDAPRMLFVGAYRREEAARSPVLAALLAPRHDGDVRRLPLEPLNVGKAQKLALALLGHDGSSERRLASAIAIEAQGSPLFVKELVRYHETRRASSPAMLEVTLDQAIVDRALDLPNDARRLLEVVALAGRPLAQGVAARAAGVGAGLLDALGLLRFGHFVRTGGAGENDVVEPYHDKIRESIAQAIPEDFARELHKKLAHALEHAPELDAEAVALHYASAGEPASAGPFAAVAAAQAARALAFDRAVRLYRLARDAEPAFSAKRRELDALLGEALVNAARGGEAAQEFLSAAAGATPARALELRRRAAEQLLRSGRVDEGLDVVHKVLSDVKLELPETRARALLMLGVERLRLRARGLDFEPRPVDQIPSELIARCDACFTAAIGLGLVESVRAAVLGTQHLLLALGTGEPHRVARGLAAEAVYGAAIDPSAARVARVLTRMSELAEQIAEPHPLAMSSAIRGIVDYLGSRFAPALEHLTRAEQRLRSECTGVAWDLGNVQLFALSSLFYLGRLAELSARGPALAREAEERGDLYTATALCTGIRNASWLISGEPERARAEVERAVSQWSKRGFHLQHWFVLLAEANIDLYRGEPERAVQRVEAVWPLLKQALLFRVRFFHVEIPDLRARALLAAAKANGSLELVKAAESDARRVARTRLPYAGPIALLLDAAIAERRPDAETATTLYARAAAAADAQGMALHAASARVRLGELIGGERGAKLSNAALGWLRSQGVAEPERLVRVVAP